MNRYLLLAIISFGGLLVPDILFAQEQSVLLPLADLETTISSTPILPGFIEPIVRPSVLPFAIPIAVPGETPMATPRASAIATPSASINLSVTPVPTFARKITAEPKRIPVLMYHYIRMVNDAKDVLGQKLSVTPELFNEQMRYLKERGYTTISPEDMHAALLRNSPLPKNPILLTFDDGYEDFYTQAMPVLEKYRFKATAFIPSDLVGKQNYLTWPQVEEMAKNPLITIGAHTRSHVKLPQVTDKQAKDEIIQSRKIFQSKLLVPVEFFAYPYGAFNEKIIELVKDAGYKGAYSTIGGLVHHKRDAYQFKRLTIDGTQGMEGFKQQGL